MAGARTPIDEMIAGFTSSGEAARNAVAGVEHVIEVSTWAWNVVPSAREKAADLLTEVEGLQTDVSFAFTIHSQSRGLARLDRSVGEDSIDAATKAYEAYANALLSTNEWHGEFGVAVEGYRLIVVGAREFKMHLMAMSRQIAANLHASESIRSAREVGPALKTGREIWQWLDGVGTHANHSPEFFQQVRCSLAPESGVQLGFACAELAQRLAEARSAATQCRWKLHALTG